MSHLAWTALDIGLAISGAPGLLFLGDSSMGCSKPTLGVAMPVRNGEATVLRFLRSFETDQFERRFSSVHLEIVDDQSTDQTFEMMEQYVPGTSNVTVTLSRNDRRLGQHLTLLQACSQMPRNLDYFATTAGDGDEPSQLICEAHDHLIAEAEAGVICCVLPQSALYDRKRHLSSIAWHLFLHNYPLLAGKQMTMTRLFRDETWGPFVAHLRAFGFPSIALGEMSPRIKFIEGSRANGRPSNYNFGRRLALFVRLLRANDRLVGYFGISLATLGVSVSAAVALYLTVVLLAQPDRPPGWLFLSALIVALAGSSFVFFGVIVHLISRAHHAIKKIQIAMEMGDSER